MKIAISGKGGVGKTTLASMLAVAAALKGQPVIAIDADPDANLAAALGLPGDQPVTPLAEMDDLIAERTGSKDNYGGYFKLNPKVDDIPDRYACRIGPIRLLTLGGVSRGGCGCICPASALVKALLTHLVIGRKDTLVMDMEAGIEHLGRATAQSMDALLIVVDPGPWSLQTALRVRKLAGDIGLQKLYAVANRIVEPAQAERISRQLGDIPLIGRLKHDHRLGEGIILSTDGDAITPTDAFRDNLPDIEAILAELRNRT